MGNFHAGFLRKSLQVALQRENGIQVKGSNKMQQVAHSTQRIQDGNEEPVVLHSRVVRPVADLTLLEQSLLMAEMAMVAYNDPAEVRRAAVCIGFPDVAFYERDGSQAYRFRNDHDCIIACRGTEPGEWNDIRADANATSVLSETVGRVHGGFKREVDDLWPMLETALMCNVQPLWFCGHSLGGAMATICAGRCLLSHIDSNPERLFSFGSPRVGNDRYVHYTKLEHFRYVNNNDIVTRVPPAWFGYQHCGDEVYLDRRGQIRRTGFAGKTRDRWIGFWRGLLKWKIDPFVDHSIHQYIRAIAKAVLEEQQQGKDGKPTRSGPSQTPPNAAENSNTENSNTENSVVKKQHGPPKSKQRTQTRLKTDSESSATQ